MASDAPIETVEITHQPSVTEAVAPDPTPTEPVEAPAAPEPEATPSPTPDTAAQLQQLAQGNARALEQIRELEKRQKQLIDPQLLAQEAQRDPMALLQQLGVDARDTRLLQGVLGDESAGAEEAPRWARQLQEQNVALQKRLEQFEQGSAKAAETQRTQARISEIHAEISKAADKFPLIAVEDAAGRQAVTDHMVSHYNQHGTAITWEQAATEVERALRESFQKRSQAAAYSALLGGQAQPSAPPAPAAGALAGSGEAPTTGDDDIGPMDSIARIKWAIGGHH